MKITQLIKELEKYNQLMEVRIVEPDEEDEFKTTAIENVGIFSEINENVFFIKPKQEEE